MNVGLLYGTHTKLVSLRKGSQCRHILNLFASMTKLVMDEVTSDSYGKV